LFSEVANSEQIFNMTSLKQNTTQQSIKTTKNKQKNTKKQNQEKSCQSKTQTTNKIYTFMQTEICKKMGLASAPVEVSVQ
jgi:hypothetical protein